MKTCFAHVKGAVMKTSINQAKTPIQTVNFFHKGIEGEKLLFDTIIFNICVKEGKQKGNGQGSFISYKT